MDKIYIGFKERYNKEFKKHFVFCCIDDIDRNEKIICLMADDHRGVMEVYSTKIINSDKINYTLEIYDRNDHLLDIAHVDMDAHIDTKASFLEECKTKEIYFKEYERVLKNNHMYILSRRENRGYFKIINSFM